MLQVEIDKSRCGARSSLERMKFRLDRAIPGSNRSFTPVVVSSLWQ